MKSSELRDWYVSTTREKITDEGLSGSAAKLLPADTVLVAMYGVTAGRVGLLKIEAALNQAICGLVLDSELADPVYMFHLLRSKYLELSERSAGAAQQNLNAGIIKSFEVRVPGLSIQRRIAAILSAFDELIEINERRIELLEDLARSLYREWFVHFRFPGHKGSQSVRSDHGRIPQGWEHRTLGEISENFDRRRKPLSRAARKEREGSFPYYGAARLIDSVDDWIFEGEHLLFAEDGTVQSPEGFPVLQLVRDRFWANNHTHILQGRGVSTQFLYLATERIPISGFVTGAAQPKITQANLRRIPILVGTKKVHAEFDLLVSKIFDMRHSARVTGELARETRDLLLPRLVAGKLDISDIDLGILEPEEVA